MSFSFSTKKSNKFLNRIHKDKTTQLRLKYKPYYHTFDRQEGSKVWLGGDELIMLSSNDYLGLGSHPKVIEAGKEALDKWGSSTTGARLANGSRQYHHDLENYLADFLGKEACHIHAAGYLSCISAIESFAERGDIIFVDKNVHSSLWAGINLSGAKYEKFSHNSAESLKESVSFEDKDSPKMVVVEGVYSMEGHICNLPEIIAVAKENSCFVVLDDAHGFGVLGNQGRGTSDMHGMTDEVDIISGSFSKALSSTGGFVAGSKEVIEYLRTHSKQTIFSAAISPTAAACALASLKILKEEPEHLERLRSNRIKYLKILEDLKLDTWDSQTPAIPIVLGNKEKVFYFWQDLMKKGVFTVMSIAPGVPPGKDLVRTSISARHTDEDFEIIAEAMAYAVKKM